VYSDAATYSFNILDAEYVVACTWNFGDGSPQVTVGDASGMVQHTYGSNRIFNVIARLHGECNDSLMPMRTIDVFDATVTGIAATQNDKDLLLYPNPATDRLTLESKGQLRIMQATVYNILGQALLNAKAGNSSAFRLNTAGLGSGSYTLMVETDKGMLVRKFEIFR